MNPHTNGIELAPGWPAAAIEQSLNSKDTKGLVKFLRSRHHNRFFKPIECLRKAAASHAGYGFSIMSLCCLLIETIQCYREGVPTTNGGEWKRLLKIQRGEIVPLHYRLSGSLPMNGEKAFEGFFRQCSAKFTGIDGRAFYANVRNGLLHQAQTKGGWKINIRFPSVWDEASHSINRNLFADALKSCFDAYLKELQDTGWSDSSWRNAARKIWWLVRLSLSCCR